MPMTLYIYHSRYANRAKNIKNNAHINEDPKDAMLREFQKEINELKMMLEEGIRQTRMCGAVLSFTVL